MAWTVVLLSLVALTGCGGSSGGVARLGCGQFCAQAGGYGGGPSGKPVIKIATTGTVVPLSDGTVPIKLKCLIPVACRGALTLGTASNSVELQTVCGTSTSRVIYWAQSDLFVEAASTRTLGITLTPCARHLLRQRRHLAAVVTADGQQVPPCRKIPQLAPGCQKFMSSHSPDQGDGLVRVVSKTIALASSG